MKIAESIIVHRFPTLIKGNDDYITQVYVFVIVGSVFCDTNPYDPCINVPAPRHPGAFSWAPSGPGRRGPVLREV